MHYKDSTFQKITTHFWHNSKLIRVHTFIHTEHWRTELKFTELLWKWGLITIILHIQVNNSHCVVTWSLMWHVLLMILQSLSAFSSTGSQTSIVRTSLMSTSTIQSSSSTTPVWYVLMACHLASITSRVAKLPLASAYRCSHTRR